MQGLHNERSCQRRECELSELAELQAEASGAAAEPAGLLLLPSHRPHRHEA